MATTQIQSSAALGKFLQRVYTDGITNQISEDFRDWEMVDKMKVSDQAARTVDFLINKSYGAPAVQRADSGTQTLPSGSQSTTEEGSAGFNQIYATVELEYDLWERAKSGAKKYLEPLAHEIQNKGIVQKRILSAEFHLDGTGVMAEVLSSVASGTSRVLTLKNTDTSRGGERYLEFGDEIIMYDNTGAASSAVVPTVSGDASQVLVIDDKDRDANTITVSAKNGGSLASVNFTDGDFAYRKDEVAPDLTGIGSTDYNSLAKQQPGLETLTATDGRTLHGLALSGVYKGEHYDASAAPIDISHIQKAMDRVKTRNGPSFKYKQVLVAPETNSAFIEANEADRRLVANSDKERGFEGFCFVHGNDKLELANSEFCGDKRMWIIPDGKAAGGCLELHGKDFKDISTGGGEYLAHNGTNYETKVQKFMMGYTTLLCRRPGAILKIHNFEN
jgi:hypothetical protein